MFSNLIKKCDLKAGDLNIACGHSGEVGMTCVLKIQPTCLLHIDKGQIMFQMRTKQESECLDFFDKF